MTSFVSQQHKYARLDDLQEIENNQEQHCEYRVIANDSPNRDGNDWIIQQILTRLEKCENELAVKEKEITLLKATVDEMKDDLQSKDELINLLKSSNDELRQQIESLKKSSTAGNKVINAMSVEADVVKSEVLTKPTNETTANNYSGRPQHESALNDISEKTIENVISQMEKDTKYLQSSLIKMETLKLEREIKCSKEECIKHIRNIENVLFMKNWFRSRDIEFSWVLQNYKLHHDNGWEVHSPIFHTTIDGYSCHIALEWEGKEKDNISVYLHLSKAKTHLGPISPFNRRCTLTLHKNRGGVEECKVDCFTLEEGKDKPISTFGFMADAPAHHFVINDSMLVSCKVHC